MSPDFTGTESPTDILNAALADFSMPSAEIAYEGAIPYLRIQHNVPTDYVCSYRLDTLLLPRFTEAEAMCDHYVTIGIVETAQRDYLVRSLAHGAMSNLLADLVLHHPIMLLE